MSTIRKIELPECETLYRRMTEDFPPGELIPYSNLRTNIENGLFDALYLTENGVDPGYAILTAFEDMEYMIWNYLAVDASCRNKGIGREFLEKIIERYRGKIIVIEVEDPQAAATEAEKQLRERRVGFYNRAGFRIVPTRRARIFGVDMLIMANTDRKIPDIRKIIQDIYSRSLEPQLLKFIDVVNMD